MHLGQVCNTSFQSFWIKGTQKHMPQLKKQRQPAQRHWKVLILLWVLVRISVLQFGQVVQIGSGPTIWAISSGFIKQNFQTSWSWIKCKFWNATPDYRELKRQSNYKIILQRFHEFFCDWDVRFVKSNALIYNDYPATISRVFCDWDVPFVNSNVFFCKNVIFFPTYIQSIATFIKQ